MFFVLVLFKICFVYLWCRFDFVICFGLVV